MSDELQQRLSRAKKLKQRRKKYERTKYMHGFIINNTLLVRKFHNEHLETDCLL